MGNASGTLKTTGQYDVKNIYDLSGNVWEFTMEKYYSTARIQRGGDSSGDTGWSVPVSFRFYSSPNDSRANYSARVALYM